MTYGTQWRHVKRTILLAGGFAAVVLAVSAIGTTVEGKWSWWTAGVLAAGGVAYVLLFLLGLGLLSLFRVRVRKHRVEHVLLGRFVIASRPLTRFVYAAQNGNGTHLLFDDGQHIRVVGVQPDELQRMNEELHEAAVVAREAERAGCDRPPRRVVVSPEWLAWQDGTVGKVAQALAREGALEGYGVLADALEDAGCRDEVMLSHLRTACRHVEGCWALDAIVGKRWGE